MTKRVLACVAAILFAGLMAAPAMAQEEGPGTQPADSPPEVLPDVVTPERPGAPGGPSGGEAVTPAPQVGGEAVTPAPQVGGDAVTPAPQVLGETTSRLPFTGGEVGGAALAGLALTAAGVALAAGARRRRSRLEAAI